MAMRLRTSHYIVGIAVLLFATGIIWVVAKGSGPGPADALAQCLTEKGAKMYGAYWCPHCQEQKKKFAASWKYVTYVECSLPGGRGQTKACDDANIEGYPTWEFGDGKRLGGVRTFNELAEATGCLYEGQDEGGEPSSEDIMPIPDEEVSVEEQATTTIE